MQKKVGFLSANDAKTVLSDTIVTTTLTVELQRYTISNQKAKEKNICKCVMVTCITYLNLSLLMCKYLTSYIQGVRGQAVLLVKKRKSTKWG